MRLLLTCLAGLMFFSFQLHPKNKIKLPGEFAKIPAGSFSLTESAGIVTINEFYMSRYEVSNAQYRQFFNEVSQGMQESERTTIAYDSTGWIQPGYTNFAMATFYFSKSDFNNYPVVNIRYEGAERYCEWLQQKLQNSNPDFVIEVKLPSREQFIWAARGGRSQAIFPWNYYYLRNKKGQKLCNFKSVNDHQIYRDRNTGKPKVVEYPVNESTTFTASVNSYSANDFGLYNTCGNVSEMITEKGIAVGGSWNDYGGDVQILAQSNYENFAATVGFRPIIVIKPR